MDNDKINPYASSHNPIETVFHYRLDEPDPTYKPRAQFSELLMAVCTGEEGKEGNGYNSNGKEKVSDDYRDGNGDESAQYNRLISAEDRPTSADERSSSCSSQLLSGPVSTPPGRGKGQGVQGSYETPDISIDTNLSNDESYFILDEGGRHVLDNQGSPARARKWQPANANQRQRYTRQHLATKGPAATCRWLQSVLISPAHLNVPPAHIAPNSSNNIKGTRVCSTTAVGSNGANPFGGKTSSTAVTSQEINGADRRREIEMEKRRRRFLAEERNRTRPKKLDGFMLMDACGCELPNEGRRADVSGRGLYGVVQEDLTYFVRLQVVDAGDNSIPFESFARLPRLEELLIPCNNIRGVRVDGRNSYCKLQRLDLSYNNLSANALSALGQLPALLDLDLTCNGLTELPLAVGHLSLLQKLSLERNQLESDGVINVLSTLPALRELNLAFNYFTGIHFTPETVEYAFPLLETLDLGFNYISHQNDVEGLILLERLQRIILYGNPLAGPTGEDPPGLCVEALINKADRIRHGWVSGPIEVITEIPRKRHKTRGGGGTRGVSGRRPYSDIGITMVDDGRLPSALEFRAAGNAALFSFESTNARALEQRQHPQHQRYHRSSPSNIVELTLRNARERCKTRHMPKKHQGAHSSSRDQVDTFLTGVERHENEIETQHRDGIFPHEDGQESDNHKDEAERRGVAGLDAAAASTLGSDGMSTRLLRGPVDPIVRGDPVKLRMALTALRYTLKHPVTSSLDIMPLNDGGGGRGKTMARGKDVGIARKTEAARVRQLPRRPYQLLKTQQERVGDIICGGSRTANTAGLGTVDAVLTSMGVGMDQMILENRAKERRDAALSSRRPGLSSIIRTVNAVLDENEY